VEKQTEPIRTAAELGDLEIAQWFNQRIQADFFDVAVANSDLWPSCSLPRFDVVLGNPPYVRYHLFTGPAREKALARARDQGVVLPNLSSMWAPFLVHACSFVTPTGRLAMVLPAELLHVQYAGPIRRFLLREFARLCIIQFERKVFPGALEEVVLLLADRRARRRGLHIARVQDLDDLGARLEEVIQGPGRAIPEDSDKWSPLLLDDKAYKAFQALAKPARFQAMKDLASVDIGIVTGANDFFFLSPTESAALGIKSRYLAPAVARAAHVAGCLFDARAWSRLEQNDEKCQLLLIDADAVAQDKALRDHIERGESIGFHQRYKCRIRSPWYSLKKPPAGDAFLCYMANYVPRLAWNDLRALNSNTVHSVRFRVRAENLMRAQVVSFYNSVTLLSCEIFARSYGGGVLKIEPSEAERLLMPRLENTRLIGQLSRMLPEIDQLIRDGKTDEVVARVDSVLLRRGFRVSPARLATVTRGLSELRHRRLARSIG
jgi:adenine-specific DNA methylase